MFEYLIAEMGYMFFCSVSIIITKYEFVMTFLTCFSKSGLIMTICHDLEISLFFFLISLQPYQPS